MRPRKGDRVRVTYEGRYFPYTDYATVETPDGLALAIPADATVEVIEDLRAGDVYRARGGRAYVYVGEHPRYDHEWIFLSPGLDFSLWRTGTPIADTEVMRPLTLLVRDGKPVTP